MPDNVEISSNSLSEDVASTSVSESTAPDGSFCRREVERMLRNSKSKVIAPIITLAILKEYQANRATEFADREIQNLYERTVEELKTFLGHDVHIGAKYYDAYGSRMSRYKVLVPLGHLRYTLAEEYRRHAEDLCSWIPGRIAEHIESRLGIVPSLTQADVRMRLSENSADFLNLVTRQIEKTPANFEIFSFAVLKVHLQKFACRIYRDTRTSAHDHGVDLSTNFGVVYQIKKLQISTPAEANALYLELKQNFDQGRMQDGNVVVIIDDISHEFRQYLVDMRVQSITKAEVLRLAQGFEDAEDRQKVLRIVFDEFRREYGGSSKPDLR